MIAHVVMYKFEHGIDKMKNMAKAKDMMEALPSQMKWINTIQVGFDFDRGKSAYDLCVYITFKTRDELMWFKSEPPHIEAENFLKEVTTESHLVDFVYDEDSCSV